MGVNHERDCPICGAETYVIKPGSGANDVLPIRYCSDDNCNWCVVISGTTTGANV